MVSSLVPQNLWHRDRRGGDAGREREKDPVRYGLNSIKKGGNGFFVNIPGQDNAIIFTAGHNLMDENGKRTQNLRAWWSDLGEQHKGIEIQESDTRVSKVFSTKPNEESAIDDFGIIMIPKNNNPPPPRAAFGFALRLAEEERLEGICNISSYLTTAKPGEPPTRSTGRFVNPILKQHQLEYLTYTEAGVSGSVVWTAYNGAPVAVAIHNYGPKRKSPKYGSRGSRIDMKMMREIMEWTGVYKRAVAIIAQPLDKVLRVHVQDDTEPAAEEATFQALPVFSAAMLLVKEPKEEIGFAQIDKGPNAAQDAMRWVSWNFDRNSVSFASALSRARLVKWDVKGPWEGKMAGMTFSWGDGIREVVFRVDDAVVKNWELSLPDTEYTGIAYQDKGDAKFQLTGRENAGLISMAQYYLDELDTESFRLATVSQDIDPDTNAQLLSVTLTKYPLYGAADLAYNALSYTWGSPRDSPSLTDKATNITILLNGLPFEVQANLYNALVELQISCSETPIWIDALCINQSNPNERSPQVSVMNQIYGKAKRVLVWLGKAFPELETGLRAVERLGVASVPETLRMIRTQTWDFSSDFSTMPERYGMDPVTEEEAIGLVALYMSNWFTRIWIIQEVSLTSDVVILCNGKFTVFDYVGYTAAFLHYSGFFQSVVDLVPKDRPGIHIRGGINIFHAERIQLLREWCKGKQSVWTGVLAMIDLEAGLAKHHAKPAAMVPLRVLFSTFGMRATDPRDSIYGWNGILKHMAAQEGVSLPSVFEPDYDMDIKDLLRDVACNIIKTTDSLVYLSLVKDPSMRETPGLPSWVPDYPPVLYNSVHGPNFRSIGTVNSSKHVPHSPNQYPFTITNKVLEAFGFRLGTVQKIGEGFLECLQGRLSMLGNILLAMDETYTYTNQQADEVFWRTLIWDTDFTNRPSKLIRLEDFQRAVAHNYVRALQYVFKEAKSASAGHSLVLQAISGMTYLDEIAAKFPDSIFPSTKLVKSLCASLDAIPQDTDGCDTKELQKLMEPLSKHAMPPGSIMASTWVYRRAFLTDTGYLGMGHESTQAGDEVWVISGSPAPLVLRKVGDSSDYCLIGESYVHGAMQGEAVTDEVTWEKVKIV
ncbi:heterokaryon incompatibility 6 OR allele [Fusarium coicis]|nr:heterokaryon incompatibility 6 OR allele [Fusarium coicis]